MTEASSDLALFLGRFHPVLVHLPIGFLVLLATLELLARTSRWRSANASAGLILALALPAAIASASCGWLLSRGPDYDASLLEWHERSSIALVVACAVLLGLHALDLKRAYRLGLAATCGLLMVASHLGGSLTHGRGYLTRYAPEPLRSWLGERPGDRRPTSAPATGGPSQLSAFEAAVQPIFRQYCVACHGPEKSKARLRLDSFAGIQRGSENGPVVKAGQATGSRLMEVLTLPQDAEGHMPPPGKAQPSADDLALIRWWIETGASPTAAAVELKTTAEIDRLLKLRAGPTR